MERSLEPMLRENVVVCGGTTKFSGYGPRLQKELELISGTNKPYRYQNMWIIHYSQRGLVDPSWRLLGHFVISGLQ